MRIYDVSGASKTTRYYGPKENDIVRYLREHAFEFCCTWDCNIPMNGGDIIYPCSSTVFTNDIFIKDFDELYKVKRMDGVFSQRNLISRNGELNRSAQVADHVIFISEFSKESYFNLYDPERSTIKKYSVISNQADPTVFYPRIIHSRLKPKVVVASASNWGRPEKRLDTVLLFAKQNPEIEILLIGTIEPEGIPSNIRTLGYLSSPQEIANILCQADAMISFAYKDACPKTMIQGVYCGLPVFYTASGGQIEIPSIGDRISDINTFSFDDTIPPINEDCLRETWSGFVGRYPGNKQLAMQFSGRDYFRKMLKDYFRILKQEG